MFVGKRFANRNLLAKFVNFFHKHFLLYVTLYKTDSVQLTVSISAMLEMYAMFWVTYVFVNV